MITRNLILDFATFTRTGELTLAEKTSMQIPLVRPGHRAYSEKYERQFHLRGRASYRLAGCRTLT
jgi:hypothetical protein